MLSNHFILPQDKVYMCGHSLGPSFKTTAESVQDALQTFALQGVMGWHQWFDLPVALGKKIAQLMGVQDHEVVVCDSTVVNLFKVLTIALALQKGRHTLLTTEDNFPADLYIAQGIGDVMLVKASEVFQHLNPSVAVLMLTHVNYRDASVLDMQTINDEAHRHGVLTIWDVSHSIGIVPLNLGSADFAVGCTYKYLSGGPGSPALVYAHAKHHHAMHSPIQGWIGHHQPFAFSPIYTSYGIKQLMGGTPPIFSMKGLQAALDVITVEHIAQAYTMVHEHGVCLIQALKNLGITVLEVAKRGGHVAFTHPYGYGFSRALIDLGIVCDYRAPDVVRLCINPLYLSLQDIQQCINCLQCVQNGALYLKPDYTHPNSKCFF
jgi:kynureninase